MNKNTDPGIHQHTIHHILTFTQDQASDMLVSAYLIDRPDVTQKSIEDIKHYFEMQLSQEYFRQRREARL